MPDFALADAEFDSQATILDMLIAAINVVATQNEISRIMIDGAQIPQIPAGGQNTMGAAAVVLLAAHFEEYIRQQIEEYAKSIIAEYAHFEDSFREDFVDKYWRSGATKLAGLRPKGSSVWMSEAGALLRGLLEYPVIGNVLEFRPDYICVHENNMRWGTVCELAGRVGVKSLSDLMFKSRKLKNILDNPRKDVFSRTLERKMNSFYELRNGIVHSISHNSGIGPTVFQNWSEFFRIFTTAFAESLSDAFKQFERGIEVRKQSALPQ